MIRRKCYFWFIRNHIWHWRRLNQRWYYTRSYALIQSLIMLGIFGIFPLIVVTLTLCLQNIYNKNRQTRIHTQRHKSSWWGHAAIIAQWFIYFKKKIFTRQDKFSSLYFLLLPATTACLCAIVLITVLVAWLKPWRLFLFDGGNTKRKKRKTKLCIIFWISN